MVAVDGCLRGVSWMYFWGSLIWCTSRSLKPKDGYSFFNAFMNRDLNQQISHETVMDSVSLRREREAQNNGASETKLYIYICATKFAVEAVIFHQTPLFSLMCL